MFYEKLFGPVTYNISRFLEDYSRHVSLPAGLFHSVVEVRNFRLCDRLDWYCILDTRDSRALFIDTGHPALTGTDFLDATLSKNEICWDQVQVFLTHFHVDHSGNLSYCMKQGASEACFVSPVPFSEELADNFLMWTRSSALMRNDIDTHEHLCLLNGENYFTDVPLERCRVLKGGDTFRIADFCFEIMPTPGHAPEHVCLIDRDKKLFIAGDHLIFAKPGMMQLAPDQHLLSSYRDSLSVIRDLKLEHVLMSHHEPLESNDEIDNFLRITQVGYENLLKDATEHVARLGTVSAYEIAKDAASHYPDGIDTFKPDMQMRRVALIFGTLEGLFDEGLVQRRQDDDGAFVYFVKRCK